jgi:L-ascorbate metabolism protein UlaG (beta-lactamase superfamily)
VRPLILVAISAGLTLSGGAAAAQALAAPVSDSSPSEGITIRYFGTATVVISDGSTVLITDGFFSRPSLTSVLTRPLSPNRKVIDASLRHAGVAKAAAVFVAHAHHDHAMDGPYVAQRTGARFVGSHSAANIARGAGLPERQIDELIDGAQCHFGAFTVTSFRTPHSRPVLFPGRIRKVPDPSPTIGNFREGGNYTFHFAHPWGNLLVVPSRGIRPDWTPPPADVVLLGVGGLIPGRRSLRPYWAQFVVGSGATRVYPIHWDSIFRPVTLGRAAENGRRIRRRLRWLRDLSRFGQSVQLLPYGDEVQLFDAGTALSTDVRSADGCRNSAPKPSSNPLASPAAGRHPRGGRASV